MNAERPNHRAALLAQVFALRSQADALEVLAHALPEGDTSDPLYDLSEPREGVSPSTLRSWIRSRRLKASQVERGRYVFRASDLRAAIEAAPVQRRERIETAATSMDSWEAQADKSLRLVGGAR
ncbi:MAG TPA: helix-turn-helix domain-containing protein [Polyangiaceae bacterium]|nr:helix-turn-helix domain-containing protein [Polyangiaceae bacterium]